MPNLEQTIARHNAKIQNSTKSKVQKRSCNCRKDTVCPLGGKCLSEGVVYGATVKTNTSQETYTGLTEPPFKTRYGVHKSNFLHKSQKGTTLSSYIWTLKDKSTPFTLDWHIIARSGGYNPSTGQCRLCLKEKWFIMFRPEGASLNKRNEFYNSCRHKARHLLGP